MIPAFMVLRKGETHVSTKAAKNKIHLAPPFHTLSNAFQKIAPIAVPKPAEIPRRPILTGYGSQTFEMVSGQKLSREKKFIPATNATTKARLTTR